MNKHISNNSINPFAIFASTPQQRLSKQLTNINREIEAEELRLISLQHKRAGILAQLDHIGVCVGVEPNKMVWPELSAANS